MHAKFNSLILLLPLRLFIHADICASNASKARAQVSLVVETFLNPVCISSHSSSERKRERKKKIFEKKQMSNIRFG